MLHGIVGGLALLVTIGCAGGSSQPSGGGAADGTAYASSSTLDAVMPVGAGWRIFQLGARREAFVRDTPFAPPWRTLAAPSGPFRPVQAVAGQRGYFHLVDAASSRLCLYDADAALLSTHPLPAEFTPFPAGRAAVFRGADGAFTFIDYGSGEAYQYADRQTIEAGATQWVPRGRVKLPAGTRECAQPAGSSDLYCRDASGAPLRFDGALNRAPVRTAGEAARMTPQGASPYAASSTALRARWQPGDHPTNSGWVFDALRPVGEGDSVSVAFVVLPLSKTWRQAVENSDVFTDSVSPGR
jgi:hypothetical protein